MKTTMSEEITPEIINSDDYQVINILDGSIMLKKGWRLYRRTNPMSSDVQKLDKSRGLFVLKTSSLNVIAGRSVKDGEDEWIGPMPLLTQTAEVPTYDSNGRVNGIEVVSGTDSLELRGIVRRL